MTHKQWFLYILTVLAAVAALLGAASYVQSLPTGSFAQADYIPMKARVTRIVEVTEDSFSMGEGASYTDRTITFEALLLNEYRKGQTVTTSQTIDRLISDSVKEVETGDTLLLLEYHSDEGYYYMFSDYWRSDALLTLTGVFMAAILIFGKLKGFNTLLGLASSCLFIFLVFVPSILAGCNIYVWSILTCLYSILFTLLIVDGYSRMTAIAAAGCFAGVLVTGVLTFIMNTVMHLSGLVDSESMFLNDLSSGLSIDLRAIIFAAIIIGATGAVMDTAVSIASSLQELSDQLEKPTFRQLLLSGITIGRDMMSTMANTLVLAYIGSSLATVLLIVAYNSSLAAIFNRELIVVEVEQAIVGSLGILSAIPLTSMLAAWIYPKKKRKTAQALPEQN